MADQGSAIVSIDLLRGSNIFAESISGAADAANIDVTANRINIDGLDSGQFTAITLDAISEGAAPAAIVVRAGDLDVRNGGLISTITGNANDAGDIFISADNLSLSGQTTSQIMSSTAPGSTRAAGNITIAGRKIRTSERLELRDRLTRHDIDNGRVNSGAIIPDQAIDRGRIVEGRLSDVVTDGLQRLDPVFVEERVRYGLDPVLDMNQLRERIELLLLDPSIARLDAKLNPGGQPGESCLI